MQQEFDGPTEHIYKTVSAPLLAAVPGVFSQLSFQAEIGLIFVLRVSMTG